nr:hypothetical protein [Arthrobacter sp. QXT-31]
MSQRVVVKDDSFLGIEKRADAAVADLVPTAWRTRSAGDGSKRIRHYAWARVRINGAEDGQAEHWLLARRNLANPSELAYFICHTPNRAALAEMARVAGVRWLIEETFQTAKGEAGLDHYQVRQYTGWYRHITLSMLAHAVGSGYRKIVDFITSYGMVTAVRCRKEQAPTARSSPGP